jgi:CRISPR-associated protein Cmr6
MPIPVLHSSKEVWQSIKNTNSIQNAGLIFQRFIPQWIGEEDHNGILGLAAVDAAMHDQLKAKRKKEAIARTKSIAFSQTIDAAKKNDSVLLINHNQRWQKIAQYLQAITFCMKTEWRLIAGLGAKSPLEVGFTFDRYGFPYLPGSCLKGIARAMARNYLYEQIRNPELTLKQLDDVLQLPEKDPKDKKRNPFMQAWNALCPGVSDGVLKYATDFRVVFGTQEESGKAIFMDSIPDGAVLPILELDIMNPHYPKYYSDTAATEPPTDSQNPIPVYFLTVGHDTTFWFGVGWDTKNDPLTQQEIDLRERTKSWLLEGLTLLGAGAKTSAGYGYFIQSEMPEPPAPIAIPVVDEPPAPAEPITQHTGKVVEIRPDKNYGYVAEEGSQKKYAFKMNALQKGWTPGKGAAVYFNVQGQTVISIERKY